MGKILVLYERNSPGASLNQRRFLLAHMTWKFQVFWLQAWLYPAAQMLSHPAHLLAQFSSVWVGFVLSQHSLLTALFHQHETLRERKSLFSRSSSKSPRIYFAWPWILALAQSCSDHLEFSTLFCLSQTYLPFKSCLSSIASVSYLFFSLFFLYRFFVKFFLYWRKSSFLICM